MTRCAVASADGRPGLRSRDRAGRARFGTIAADVDPTRHPRSADQSPCRPPRSGGASSSSSPSAATRSCPSASLVPAGDQTLLFTNCGMVQFKDVLTGAETAQLHPGRRLPALPARRRQAQRLRGGRPDAAPPHAVRDARQLELRRLLQARGDPLGVGLPDPRPRASRASAWRPRPTRPTTSPSRSGATRSACRRSGSSAGATSPTATRRTGGGWPTSGRAGRAARSTSTAARTFSEGPECVPDHSEHCPRWLEIWNLVFMEFELHPDRLADAAAGPGRRHRAWASSASPASSSRSRRTTTPTCSRRSTPGCGSCSATTRTPSSRSASATRSSPTTRAPSRSSSPMTSFPAMKGGATSCAASCVAPCATAGCWGGASRSWPRRRPS